MQLDYTLVLYLHRYGNLPLPGQGHLSFQKQTARISFPDRKIYPGQNHIYFSEKNLPEFHLLKWLSVELGVDYHLASELMNKWVASLIDLLRSDVDVVWHGVGRMRLSDKNGIIQIEQDPALLIQPELGIHAEKVIRTGVTHSVLVGENEKSSEEMEEALQQKHNRPKKVSQFLLFILFVIGCASVLLISIYFSDAWRRLGNHHPIKAEETPSRNQWVP